MLKITVNSAEETQQIAQKLALLLKPQDVILLEGDLGAGKTTFTKGLALGLGIHHNIKSPTFTIICEYQQGRLPLYHMDVYRLEETGGEILGLEEYFEGDGVSVVEWSNFIKDELPPDNLTIVLEKDDNNDNKRYLSFTAHGKRYQELLQELKVKINNI